MFILTPNVNIKHNLVNPLTKLNDKAKNIMIKFKHTYRYVSIYDHIVNIIILHDILRKKILF